MASGSHSKRKKKSSQKRSKKRTKSTKDKTKKRKRRHDSVSSSDEDAMSNSSVSSYSSKDDFRSKKRARSRDRKDRKDSKKKAKRSRSVSESSRDDSPHVTKRKKLKKGKDSESRKKRHGKKRRRSPSVSSASHSLSECSDDSEREFERKEVKATKRKEKVKVRSASKKREKGKAKRVSKSSRGRSKRGSPSSIHSESHSYGSEDRVLVEENNPKRLKSIIVVAHGNEEVEIRESNWDGNKAEIIFEKDEYPSRSNDSNDGVSRREASTFLHDVSSGEPRYLNDSNNETLPTEVWTSEIPEGQSLVALEPEGIQINEFGSSKNDQMNGDKIGGSTETVDSNCDDLATTLRQKALENFLKRKGKSLTQNATDKKGYLNNELNTSPPLKTNVGQHISDSHSDLKSVQKLGRVDELNYTTEMPSLAKGKDDSLPKRESGISRLGDKYTAPSGFAESRKKLGLSTPRKEFVGARNTWRRQESSLPNVEKTLGKDLKIKLHSEESSEPNRLTPKKSIDKDSKRQFTSQEVSKPNLSVPKDALDLGSSRGSGPACLESTVGTEKIEGEAATQPSAMVEHSSNEKTNDGDRDSQFQQKTMSVMRGGEMVQVSYKVYIPNKAPALARRQLKR